MKSSEGLVRKGLQVKMQSFFFVGKIRVWEFFAHAYIAKKHKQWCTN